MKRVYKRKLTLWFTGDTKPLANRPGVYPVSGEQERHRRGGPIFYAYWNGSIWGVACRSADEANNFRNTVGTIQHRAWRGRTEP